MTRFVPRSLIGQVALLLGVALLVAQLINFALILNERQKLSLARDQGPAIVRFAAAAADVDQASSEFREAVVSDASHRGARFALATASSIGSGTDRDAGIEQKARESLADSGVRAAEVRASFTSEQRRDRDGKLAKVRILILSLHRADGSWLNASLPTPLPDPLLAARLGGATLALYLIVLGSSLLIVWRLVRPLRDLTNEAERFQGRGAPVAVPSRGPADLRRAIEAFNAMNHRMAGLLTEKDVMLGAIGHDLRTPLASLRIRVENLEPASERESAVATIGQMEAMLDDILFFARTGRTQEEARRHDLTAFAEAIVEEYRELGRPVTFIRSPRVEVMIQPNLVKRAIRNLIDNAVTYGGSAEVSVCGAGRDVIVGVRDRGGGLPENLLESVLEPFARSDTSRNRERGGSGLGLAITVAVAEAHRGSCSLTNVPDGGVLASLTFPCST